MRKYGLVVTGLVLVLCLLAPLGTARGSPDDYTVNTTDDDVDVGGCQQAPTGDCTLREAITDANDDGDVSNIAFNIPTSDGGYNPSTGVWTIQLGSALPDLTEDGTGIMGSTQTGNQGDTNPNGPEIAVNGASAYACFDLRSAHNTIEGLAINQCTYGIKIVAPAHHNTIIANYIGLNAQGTAASGNTQTGIYIAYASDNTVGGGPPGARNIISGNGEHGVWIHGDGADRNDVSGNYIGTDSTGVFDVANTWDGVAIGGGPQENDIGPDNIIAYNDVHGVLISGATTISNTVTQNTIHSNGGEGISLINEGNGTLSAPSIDVAMCTGGGGTSGPNLRIEVFSDYNGEGRFYESYVMSASGSFALSPAGTLFRYPYVTLTATDAAGNTSEFSAPEPSGCLFSYLPLGMKRY
jgi:CSLREA domain-containing protein